MVWLSEAWTCGKATPARAETAAAWPVVRRKPRREVVLNWRERGDEGAGEGVMGRMVRVSVKPLKAEVAGNLGGIWFDHDLLTAHELGRAGTLVL